jgi:hypothetical protein
VTHNPDNTRYVQRVVRIRDGQLVGEEAGMPAAAAGLAALWTPPAPCVRVSASCANN